MKNLFVKSLILFCFLFFSKAALADQQSWITDITKTIQAKELLQESQLILKYCEPCSNSQPKLVDVDLVEIWRDTSNAKSYSGILLNNKKIDLAYIFIRSSSGWQNLAIALDLPVNGVSEYIVLADEERRLNFADVAINECKIILTELLDKSSTQAETNNAVYDQLDCLISRVTEYIQITNQKTETEAKSMLDIWLSGYMTFTRNYMEGSKMCDQGCGSFYSSDPAQKAIQLLEFTLRDMSKYE